MIPIRPQALAIALGIHVVIIVAVLVARDWNAEPPPPPERAAIQLTTIETVPPPPVALPGAAPGSTAPAPVLVREPVRPKPHVVTHVVSVDEQARAVADVLTSDSSSSTIDVASRPSADLDASGSGGSGDGGAGGHGGGAGIGDGVDLSAKPQPLDTTSASVLPYTKDAMSDHVEGDVTLVLQIDDAGIVVGTRLQRGIGHGLDEIAATVARKFTFKPALDRHGKKTAGTVKWRFHFTRPA